MSTAAASLNTDDTTSPCCSRLCQGLRQSAVLANKTASNSDGVQKAGGLAVKIIELVGALLGYLSKPVDTLRRSLKTLTGDLSILEVFQTIKWWVCETATSWQKTASMVAYSAMGVLGIMNLLDTINAVDFTRLFSKWCSVPLFGILFSSATILGSGFGMWDSALTLSKTNAKIEELSTQRQTTLKSARASARAAAAGAALAAPAASAPAVAPEPSVSAASTTVSATPSTVADSSSTVSVPSTTVSAAATDGSTPSSGDDSPDAAEDNNSVSGSEVSADSTSSAAPSATVGVRQRRGRTRVRVPVTGPVTTVLDHATDPLRKRADEYLKVAAPGTSDAAPAASPVVADATVPATVVADTVSVPPVNEPAPILASTVAPAASPPVAPAVSPPVVAAPPAVSGPVLTPAQVQQAQLQTRTLRTRASALKVDIENVKLFRNKTILSIAYDAAKIALAIMTIVTMVFCPYLLIPTMAFGVAVAALGLFRFLYEQNYDRAIKAGGLIVRPPVVVVTA